MTQHTPTPHDYTCVCNSKWFEDGQHITLRCGNDRKGQIETTVPKMFNTMKAHGALVEAARKAHVALQCYQMGDWGNQKINVYDLVDELREALKLAGAA